MTKHKRTNARVTTSLRMVGRGLAAVAASLFLSGCGDLLEVELPGSITEDGLLDPALAETLVLSAVADFECAYSDFTAAMGGLEDAFWESTGWWTRAFAEYNVFPTTGAVNTTPCGTSNTAVGFFSSFQSARFQAEQAYDVIGGFEGIDDAEELLAQSATYAGYVYQVFGEHWCEVAVDRGPLMTPEETLREAEEWFDLALGHVQSTGDFSTPTTNSIEQLIHLGRARVRFALGDTEGARQDALRIEPSFSALITRDPGVRKRWNQVVQHHTINKYSTITPGIMFQGEQVAPGYRNLTIAPDGTPTVGDGVPDPRVPVEDTGALGQDGVTPHFIQTKYTNLGDPIPMARWAEAQLILAEIEGGQSAVARINALRDVHGLPHVSEVTQDLIIEERRREFFFEGRFHADKLRYGLWFPEGQGLNHKNIAYGPTTCLPLSDQERQLNPNVPN